MSGDVVYIVSTSHGYIGERGKRVMNPMDAEVMSRQGAVWYAQNMIWDGRTAQAWSLNTRTLSMRKVHKA